MQHAIRETPKLEVYLGSVHDLIIEEGKCCGVVMQNGEHLRSDKVIITTGTFLGGRCYIGQHEVQAGRFLRKEEGTEPASNALA
jgi:tRNA uridine 5-carboxymethylaminomethyl modification enzyme